MKRPRSIRVLVLLNQTLKAARDEISGILRAASALADMDVRIFERNLSPDALRERLIGWIPNGIITDNRGTVPTLLPGKVANCLTLNLDKPRQIPVVYLDFIHPAASSIGVDDADIGRCAASFFLKRKYENFAFVGTNLRHTSGHALARLEAFASTVGKAGFPCQSFTFNEQHPGTWTQEFERLTGWIAALRKPCAVLAHADVYARLTNDACRLAKVSIPEQVALIGVDNEIDIADNMRPTLSSILPDFEKGGFLAVETLWRLLSSRRVPRKPLRVSYGVKALVERGSTQDTHGASRLVDAARALVRARAREGIRVAAIARELGVSPRLLELHFKVVLGHSVRDELIDYRLEEVKRLLRTTKTPIESIALPCGWRSPIALKLLFRKRFGLSMREFRRSSPPANANTLAPHTPPPRTL